MKIGQPLKHLASLAVVSGLVFLAVGSTDKPSTSKHKAPAAPAPVQGTEKRLEYEVKRALGTSNRKVAKVSKIQVTGQTVHVYFSVDDNLTDGMIKTSAKMDVEDILKAVQKSGYDYSEITVLGTFPLQDKFGNSKESKVLHATYERSTVDRINWQGFLTDNMYDIGDGVWLHPTFR